MEHLTCLPFRFCKDKMTSVRPRKSFDIPKEEVTNSPSDYRYRYLCWAEAKMGRPLKGKTHVSRHDLVELVDKWLWL